MMSNVNLNTRVVNLQSKDFEKYPNPTLSKLPRLLDTLTLRLAVTKQRCSKKAYCSRFQKHLRAPNIRLVLGS